MRSPGCHTISRSLAALLIVTLLAACTPGPDLKASLQTTAERFYADLVSGLDPYGSHTGAKPVHSTLPASPATVSEARVTSVTARATGAAATGQWQVETQVRVGPAAQGAGPAVTYTELTKWTYRDKAWKLESVELRDPKIHGWPLLAGMEAGTVAFGHGGRVWLLATDTGALTQVGSGSGSGRGSEPLLHAGWSPDGNGLILHSELEGFWYTPGNGEVRSLGRMGPVCAIDWSPGGRYAAIDSGTDVIRQIDFLDSRNGTIVLTISSFLGIVWGPEPGTFAYIEPIPVDPPLWAGDGSSQSLAFGWLGQNSRTETLVPGTSTTAHSLVGFGRDGQLYYRSSHFAPGQPQPGDPATLYRWDFEASKGVRLPAGQTPEVETHPTPRTITKPGDLGGPTGPGGTLPVSVSPGGRWGMFTAQDAAGVSGVYVIDLLNPQIYVRLVAGHGPVWRPAATD